MSHRPMRDYWICVVRQNYVAVCSKATCCAIADWRGRLWRKNLAARGLLTSGLPLGDAVCTDEKRGGTLVESELHVEILANSCRHAARPGHLEPGPLSIRFVQVRFFDRWCLFHDLSEGE